VQVTPYSGPEKDGRNLGSMQVTAAASTEHIPGTYCLALPCLTFRYLTLPTLPTYLNPLAHFFPGCPGILNKLSTRASIQLIPNSWNFLLLYDSPIVVFFALNCDARYILPATSIAAGSSRSCCRGFVPISVSNLEVATQQTTRTFARFIARPIPAALR
jgi:hypothetical protein